MENKPLLNIKSLKEQVYEYLREQMRKGALKPGAVIDMNETSKKLGVSKTPLRDALLQLEMEDFVNILPRKKVVVNVLTVKDIKNYYEIIGALESAALWNAFERMKPSDIAFMEKMNRDMKKAIDAKDFDRYYEKNLRYHETYLNLGGNASLVKIVSHMKKRLYDFPRPPEFIKEWEEASIGEHERLIRLIKSGKKEEAISFVRDIHWSYDVQERYIRLYYSGISLAD